MKKRISIALLSIFIVSNIYGAGIKSIKISENLIIKKIDENVWIHTSYKHFNNWGKVPANGLVIIDSNDILLIDTPWDNELTKLLVEWVSDTSNANVSKVIVTHYHEDRIGGLQWIHGAGIESYSISKTQDICKEKKLTIPKNSIDNFFSLNLSKGSLQVYFPGEGHTVDSVCVYLSKQKILFGGCSVKALNNKGLGNVTDANLVEWPTSLQRMKDKFSLAEIVIPGHGKEGSIELLNHTISLCRKRK